MTGANVPNSDAVSYAQPATVYWKAVYSGDTGNNGASSTCVLLTVKAAPALALVIAPNPVRAGSSATATATLSAASSTAGGTVTYTVYTESSCATQISPAQVSTKTVTNGVVPASTAFTISTAGAVFLKATYSGDAANNPATGTCVPLTVSKATPTLTLVVTPTGGAGKAGSTARGKGTLAGATSTAAGTATYSVYSESSCTTVLPGTNNPSTKTVKTRTVPTSARITINLAGTVYWKVVYAGDANNAAAVSPCVALAVAKATPVLTLTSRQRSRR
ncbi:MAG: hypothetical protein H0U61_10040 [Nocardioidaceae bacterium]|nr:hypothetical protein [Nocardioidaceae bacterium]